MGKGLNLNRHLGGVVTDDLANLRVIVELQHMVIRETNADDTTVLAIALGVLERYSILPTDRLHELGVALLICLVVGEVVLAILTQASAPAIHIRIDIVQDRHIVLLTGHTKEHCSCNFLGVDMGRHLSCGHRCGLLQHIEHMGNHKVGEGLGTNTCNGVQILNDVPIALCFKQVNLTIVGSECFHGLRCGLAKLTQDQALDFRIQLVQIGSAVGGNQVRETQLLSSSRSISQELSHLLLDIPCLTGLTCPILHLPLQLSEFAVRDLARIHIGVSKVEVASFRGNLIDQLVPNINHLLLVVVLDVVTLGLNEAAQAGCLNAIAGEDIIDVLDICRGQVNLGHLAVSNLALFSGESLQDLLQRHSLLADLGEVEVHRVVTVVDHGRQNNLAGHRIEDDLGIVDVLQANELVLQSVLRHVVCHFLDEAVHLVDLYLCEAILLEVCITQFLDRLKCCNRPFGSEHLALSLAVSCTHTEHLLGHCLELGTLLHLNAGLSLFGDAGIGGVDDILFHSDLVADLHITDGHLIVLTCIRQGFCKELLNLFDRVCHLKDSFALCRVRSLAIVNTADLVQKVVKELLHLIEQSIIFCLQFKQFFHDIAISKHSLHGVCYHFGVGFLVGDLLATLCRQFSLLCTNQLVHAIALLIVLYEEISEDLIFLGRPLFNEVGQLVSQGEQHKTVATTASIQVDMNTAIGCRIPAVRCFLFIAVLILVDKPSFAVSVGLKEVDIATDTQFLQEHRSLDTCRLLLCEGLLGIFECHNIAIAVVEVDPGLLAGACSLLESFSFNLFLSGFLTSLVDSLSLLVRKGVCEDTILGNMLLREAVETVLICLLRTDGVHLGRCIGCSS